MQRMKRRNLTAEDAEITKRRTERKTVNTDLKPWTLDFGHWTPSLRPWTNNPREACPELCRRIGDTQIARIPFAGAGPRGRPPLFHPRIFPFAIPGKLALSLSKRRGSIDPSKAEDEAQRRSDTARPKSEFSSIKQPFILDLVDQR